MPVRQQKDYLLLLLHAQKPKVIYIADVKPLNMVTYLAVSRIFSGQVFVIRFYSNDRFFCLQLLKAIFSYGMIFGKMMQ